MIFKEPLQSASHSSGYDVHINRQETTILYIRFLESNGSGYAVGISDTTSIIRRFIRKNRDFGHSDIVPQASGQRNL